MSCCAKQILRVLEALVFFFLSKTHVTNSLLLEVPYRELAGLLDQANLQLLDDTTSFIFALAAAPNNACYSYDLVTRVKGAALFIEPMETGSWCPIAAIASEIGFTDKVIHIKDSVLLDTVELGAAALINDEIVRIDAIDLTNNQLTIGRGCIDTVPTQHKTGATIWFYDSSETSDDIEYNPGTIVETKLLSNTFTQRLDPTQAPTKTITVQGRQARPYPPGNLKINGAVYPATVADGTINLSWAHRNRLLQADKLIDTTASNVTLESNTTYNLKAYFKNAQVANVTRITETNYKLVLDTGYKDVVVLRMSDLTDLAGKNWAAQGGAVFDTTNIKVGTASLKLAGNGWIQTIDHLADFAFSSDFTVEAWIYPTQSGGYQVIVNNYYSGLVSWQFALNNNKLCFWSSSLGYQNSNASIPLSTWSHVAISRENGKSRFFINGVLDRELTDNTSYVSPRAVCVGSQSGSYNYFGNIDQVRMTKNLARFTANFTPSTSPYDYEESQASAGEIRIELDAVRDGLASLQKHNYSFSFEP